MKKLFGLLVMGAMIAAPMHAMTVDLSKVDVGQFTQKAEQLKEKLAVLVPELEKAVAKARSGDFAGLRADLQARASEIDLGTLTKTAADYFGPAKSFFASALSNLQKNPQMISQVVTLSEDQLTAIKNAARSAESNLDYLDVVKNNLFSIATNANLALAIDAFVNALEKASKDGRLMSKIEEFIRNIGASYRTVESANFQAIASAVPVGVKVVKKETIRGNEVITLAKGLGQVRRIVPALVHIIQQLADLALTTNPKLVRDLQMDSRVKKAVDEVNKNAELVFATLKDVNAKLDAALKR